MTDLTKIDVPFGELDIETKLALHRACYEGKKLEFFSGYRWHEIRIRPGWSSAVVYRVKPTPLTDIVIPWEAIDPQWKWAARDARGGVLLGKTKLMCDKSRGYWYASGGMSITINNLIDISLGNKPWDESLIERPSGV